MPQVAFYTRISTDEDRQKYSLGAQKDRLEAFCTSQYGNDWKLFRIYRDTDSGTHMNRDGLEEMLFDAEAQAFDTLLVFRVDRLSRKVRELALMVDELTRYGVTLRSITEPFDTASAAGKMMLQMLGVFAEFEHATIVERTKMGMEKKAKGGEWVGGTVPYGYRLDPEKGLLIDKDEAVVIRKIFRMYAFGKEGTFTVARKLNEAGHRKRSGRKWDKRVILHMLRNPLYLGKLRWRGSIYEARHEPIVSDTLFKKAEGVLRDRVKDLKGRQWHNGDERLLTGIMKCGCCSSHMFGGGGYRNGRHVPYYVCAKRHTQHECHQDYIRAESLEVAVIQDIKTILRDEQLMGRICEEVNRRLKDEQPNLDKEIGNAKTQMAETEVRLARYFEAFESGAMSPDLCGQNVESLKTRLEELEAENRRLEARRKGIEVPTLGRAALPAMVDNFEEVMASGTNPQKKHLLHRMVKKVLVHDRRTIEIWYGLPGPNSIEHWENWLPQCAGLRTRPARQSQRYACESSTEACQTTAIFRPTGDRLSKSPWATGQISRTARSAA